MKIKLFKQRSEKVNDQHAKDIVEVQKLYKEQFDVDVYLAYGTLLGAIRDEDFIDHDRDIDLAYMSKHNNMKDIYQEWIGIMQFFKDAEITEKFTRTAKKAFKYVFGKDLPLHYNKLFKRRNCGGQFHFWVPTGTSWIDMWTAWTYEEKYFCSRRTLGDIKHDLILPLKKTKLRGVEVSIPNKPEKYLEYLYGPDWKTPVNYMKNGKARQAYRDKESAYKFGKLFYDRGKDG